MSPCSLEKERKEEKQKHQTCSCPECNKLAWLTQQEKSSLTSMTIQTKKNVEKRLHVPSKVLRVEPANLVVD